MNMNRLFIFIIISLCSGGSLLIILLRLGSEKLNLIFQGNFILNISTEDELLMFGRRFRFPNGVPRIVHYSYISHMIPEQYAPLIDTCVSLNPDILFVLWTDAGALRFMRKYFQKYAEIYESFNKPTSVPLKKSDILRYFILEQFGGIYMDLDTRCQRPMVVAMQTEGCILSKEAEVSSKMSFNIEFIAMNSFMACIPNHQFFAFLINLIKPDQNMEILATTGPIFLTNAFLAYNASFNVSDVVDPRKDVFLAPSDTFSPYIDASFEYYCSRGGVWRNIGCKEHKAYLALMPAKIKKAVVVHLFFHFGTAGFRNRVTKLVDIRNLTNTVKYIN